ncbi:outer membrane beta-barrel protein [Chitinophaga sp.]|uniref:outer membrane beta-barrel protein n=1 Tax=Chitinophaga sp. TaxID=1869181 RepID=UPI0031DD4137
MLSAVFTAVGQQKGLVLGQLSDTTTHQLLKDAFITFNKTSDSTVQKTIFSGEDGHFACSQLPMGHYYLKINFQGFSTVTLPFVLDKSQVDLGTLYMYPKVKMLDTIVVLESAVIVKKDTTEFNASRFPTPDYASLDALLALLPGIQLNNGVITVNGQEVDHILIDGKPFFDGSPRMALEHLPADIIKKIQVYASKDKNNIGFPSLPGLPGNKTLNILLKDDKKKGNFGKILAGAGTSGTYTANADLNHMNGGQQLSIISKATNVTPESRISNTSNGITRQIEGGINYRDSRDDKVSINGSVQTNDMRNESTRRSHLLNIYSGDSSTVKNMNVKAISDSRISLVNATIEYKPDEQDVISIQPRVSLQQGNTSSGQDGYHQYASSKDTIYKTNGNNYSNSNNTAASSLLQYTHNWKQPGKILIASLNIAGNTNHRSVTAFTQTNTSSQINEQHQHNTNSESILGIDPSVTYTMPIRDKLMLNLQGKYSYKYDAMSYKVYSYNEEGKYFDIIDTSNSNDYLSIYQTGMIQATLSRQWKLISLQAGTGVESDWLLGNNQTENKQTSRKFLNVLPEVMLGFNVGKDRNVLLSYSGKPISVDVQQLQPVSVTTDSLYITEGNPDLLQPYIHTISFSYSAITSHSGSFSASFSANSTRHSIQQSLTLKDNGVQVSKPVNLNGAQDFSLQLNYSIPAINRKSSYGFSTNNRYSKTPVISNGIRNDSRIYNLSAGFTYSYIQKDGVNFSFSTTPGYSAIQTINGTNSQYFTTSFNSTLSYFWQYWSGAFTAYYTYNNSLPSSYRTKYPTAITSITYRFLKHKQAELKFSIIDLFNQQSGVSRSITASVISDSWTQTRGRYFQGTISYNFRKFGTKK